MSLFGNKERQTISRLESELERKNRRISQLESLCAEKDEYFLGAISDGLRHGSSEAGRHIYLTQFKRIFQSKMYMLRSMNSAKG